MANGDRSFRFITDLLWNIGSAAVRFYKIFVTILNDGTNEVTVAAVKGAVDVAHARAHAIDGTSDHTGVSGGTDGNFLSRNAGGLPQDSGISLDTDNTLAADSDTRVPSQKAIKDYVAYVTTNLAWQYFLNDTASVGAYYTMASSATGEAQSVFTAEDVAEGNTLIASFLTDEAVPFSTMLAGAYNARIYAKSTESQRDCQLYWELYEYETDTTETLIMTSAKTEDLTYEYAGYGIHAALEADYELSAGSKLLLKVYTYAYNVGVAPDVSIAAENTTNSYLSVSTSPDILQNIYVMKSLFDANTILAADSDNTPTARTIAEARIVGRKTGGTIGALTGAEAATIIGSIPSTQWNQLSALATTAPNAYSFTITGEDWTGTILPGMWLKLKLSGTYIYAAVQAVAYSSNTTVTIVGPDLTTGAGDLAEAFYADPTIPPIEYMVEGNWAAAIETDLLRDVAKTPIKWLSSKAYLVGYSASQETVDTGAEGKLNVEINGASVNTNDSNNGIQLGAANTWVDSWSATDAGGMSTSNYDINFGEELELSCTAAGGSGDARNLVAVLIFVRP